MGLIKDKKGVALIVVYLVIVVLLILGGAFLLRAIWEQKIAERGRDFKQALYIAEAGIDRAVYELKKDYNNWAGWSGITFNFAEGEYRATCEAQGGYRKVAVIASIPNFASARIARTLEAFIRKEIPSNFYENAVYDSGKLTIEGDEYAITGDVRYAGKNEIEHPELIDGDIIEDGSISPLPMLDFQQLHDIAQGQGNVYDEARINDVKKGDDSFPASFWYAEGVPNVVYVEATLKLDGDIGTIGGFFVVAGDVLTNPEQEENTIIDGYGTIEGAIYSTGKFDVEGDADGGGLSISGGVWSGKKTKIEDRVTINFNETYMNALANLGITPGVQIVSWREIR